MQPISQDLILIQDEIRSSFGWSLQSDYDSALQLCASYDKNSPKITLPEKVTVVGAAAPPGYVPLGPTIVADEVFASRLDILWDLKSLISSLIASTGCPEI